MVLADAGPGKVDTAAGKLEAALLGLDAVDVVTLLHPGHFRVFLQILFSHLFGQLAEVAVAGSLDGFRHVHGAVGLHVRHPVAVAVVHVTVAVQLKCVGVIQILDGCRGGHQLEGGSRREGGPGQMVDVGPAGRLQRRFLRIVGRSADHAEDLARLVVVDPHASAAAVHGLAGGGAKAGVQCEIHIFAGIVQGVDAVDEIISDQLIHKHPVGAGGNVVVLVSGDVHAGSPDGGGVIEDHAVLGVSHQQFSMAVIESALGQPAVREDVPVALIGCPFTAVADIPHDEYGQPRHKHHGKQEAHHSSSFYFLHLLSPPNRSSRVTG